MRVWRSSSRHRTRLLVIIVVVVSLIVVLGSLFTAPLDPGVLQEVTSRHHHPTKRTLHTDLQGHGADLQGHEVRRAPRNVLERRLPRDDDNDVSASLDDDDDVSASVYDDDVEGDDVGAYYERPVVEFPHFEDGDFDDFGGSEEVRRSTLTNVPPVSPPSQPPTDHPTHPAHPATPDTRPQTATDGDGDEGKVGRVVQDEIYWSPRVEELIPQGVTEEQIAGWLSTLSSRGVAEMHAASWSRCGRPSNQYAVLAGDGGRALCARYRHPHQTLIRGEVLTFHLARLLALDAAPLVVLSRVNSSAPQWTGVNVTGAGWTEGALVALITWLDGLDSPRSRVKMPGALLAAYRSGRPLSRHTPDLLTLTPPQLSLLAQWTDMILLDFITGHYDRVASMQDGAERENQPDILTENIRNLRQDSRGKLWLIDNESGLFDAYQLMYGDGGQTGAKFVEFHERMLKTMCVFRRHTVERVRRLSSSSSGAGEVLEEWARRREPLYGGLAADTPPADSVLFHTHFHKRLKQVVSWIDHCHRHVSRVTSS